MASHAYPASSTSPYWGLPVATAGSLPVDGVVGEVRLVLDTDDLYEWNGASWERITQNSADVTGPASATANALPRFNGTTGNIIKDGPIVVADNGDTTGVHDLTATGALSAASASFTAALPVASGGTNSQAALTNNRIMRSTTGAVVEAAAITAARALISDANGIPTHSAVTATELGYVGSVTSAIQTQLDAKLAKAGGTMTGDLTLAGDPDSALKAATKQYVDSVAAGLDVKPSVKNATTATITLSGEQTLDGVLTATSRVLVKNQSAPAENGIYVSAAGAWARATDMDAWTEVPGSFVFIEQGTLYGDTAWVCTANAGGTIGSTSITWSQFAGAGTYTADGQGIELTGTQYGLELDGTTLSKSATGLKVAALGITNAEVSASAGIAQTKMAALTASRALVTDVSGFAAVATTSAAEIGFVNGVTSAIQTQLNAINAGKGIVSVAGDVTLTNQRIHLVDTSAARSLTLPAPAATSFIVIKDKTGSCATNNITVVRAAAEKIETVAASFVLDSDLGSWTLVSDGTDWFII